MKVRFVLVGPKECGKTSLALYTLKRARPLEYSSTDFDVYSLEMKYEEKELFQIDIVDTSGKTEDPNRVKLGFDRSDCDDIVYLLCASMDSPHSLHQAQTFFYQEIMKYESLYKEKCEPRTMRSPWIVLVGTKSDRLSSSQENIFTHPTTNEFRRVARDLKLSGFATTSTLTGCDDYNNGVFDLLHNCVSLVVSNRLILMKNKKMISFVDAEKSRISKCTMTSRSRKPSSQEEEDYTPSIQEFPTLSSFHSPQNIEDKQRQEEIRSLKEQADEEKKKNEVLRTTLTNERKQRHQSIKKLTEENERLKSVIIELKQVQEKKKGRVFSDDQEVSEESDSEEEEEMGDEKLRQLIIGSDEEDEEDGFGNELTTPHSDAFFTPNTSLKDTKNWFD